MVIVLWYLADSSKARSYCLDSPVSASTLDLCVIVTSKCGRTLRVTEVRGSD